MSLEEKHYSEKSEDKNFKTQLLQILSDAEDDVQNKRIAPISKTSDDLRIMLEQY